MHSRLLAVCIAATLFLVAPSLVNAQAAEPASGSSPNVRRDQFEGKVGIDVDATSQTWRNSNNTAAYEENTSQPLLPGAAESDIEARFNAMQAEIDALKSRDNSPGINPDRMRSSDMPPLGSNIPDQAKLEGTKYPTIKLTGFFQADAGFFDQSPANVAALGNIQDVVGFRRARLAAVGDVAEDVSYMLEVDFAFPGRPSFMDVWVDVHSVPLFGNVRVGQWRQWFGMDNLTSVRELTFLERDLAFAFTPFRQTGVGFYNSNEDKSATWAGSVFKHPTDFWGDATGDKGYGASGRVTRLLVDDDDGKRLLHVGGEYALTRPSTRFIDYRNQPEFGGPFVGPSGNVVSVPFFVDTGLIPASTANLLNAELAGILGSFHFQTEATWAFVDRTNASAVTFPSYSAQAGYILTGETRGYNKNNAVLARVKPNCPTSKGGIGAWEVASRWSYIDLNANGVNGGRLNDYTFGLNWYLNDYAKFQFNYIRASLNDLAVGHSSANLFVMRAQLDF